jgi:ubiquinone/menaquinone biosynthesis C-methylase UbiE
MDTSSINLRYTMLSKETCCLSCGGALHFADPQPGEYCVDLGSGKGTDALRMATKVGAGGFVYGIDISEGMLETARKNAEKLSVKNIVFVQSDLEEIAVPSGVADVLISNCTLNHVADKQKVWNEIYRILKPGGRFIISDIYALEPVPEEYKNNPAYVAECWAGASTRNEYLETVKSAQLEDVSILEESQPYAKGLIHVSGFTIFGRKK